MSSTRERIPVPRDRENDYTHEAAATRRAFAAKEVTGARLKPVGSRSQETPCSR